MNITYRQNGDYLIPNIVIRKTKPIGHYGRLRKAYLETYRDVYKRQLSEMHWFFHALKSWTEKSSTMTLVHVRDMR